MHNFLQDLRVALRTLGKNPGFTLVVALSIGMGIGASTAVFTWMDNVLFNPFPVVRESGKLLALNPVEVGEQVGGMRPVPYTDYVEWRGQTKSFSDTAGSP